MALMRAAPVTFKPTGCSDAVDATNAFPGAMRTLSNLVPDPSTDKMWVPRPASLEKFNFLITQTGDTDETAVIINLTDTSRMFAGMVVSGDGVPDGAVIASVDSSSQVTLDMATTATATGVTLVFDGGYGFVSGLLVVGDLAYGMVASGRNSGKDEPFVYNLATDAFLTVAGITNANSPTSPSSSGDWTPPILAQVGTRIIVCHSGFAGGAIKFGWFDISSFSLAQAGDTHTNTTVDGLASTLGVQPGMLVSGSAADIPAGDTVVSTTAASVTLLTAATGSNAGQTITITGGTPTAPLWGAGDTNPVNLPSVPVGVGQFNGRAYFAVGTNGIVYSDSGLACQVTNATQALTTNDGLAVTAIGPLTLQTLLGGIVQGLIAFEGISKMQQITGDETTSNLAMNALPVATGTLAPLTITPCELGLAFVSDHGLRIVKFDGTLLPIIGDHGQGIAIPFINAINPSRMCASANSDVIRITVKNGATTDQAVQEWWWDLTRKVWSGPHTFPASLIQPWGDQFLLTGVGIDAKVWSSAAQPDLSSTYTENGVAMAWQAWTSLLPDNAAMAENEIIETTLAVALPGDQQLQIDCLDEDDSGLDSISLVGSGPGSTIWGAFVWGAAPWGGPGANLKQYPLYWNTGILFKQMSVRVGGASILGTRLGNLYMRYQILGYQVNR